MLRTARVFAPHPLCAAALIALLCRGVRDAAEQGRRGSREEHVRLQLGGERIVIRFDAGEARLLMPDGNRVSLYQIPAASGVRFSNGIMELRGKGMDLQLVRHGVATPLKDCQPFVVPPK